MRYLAYGSNMYTRRLCKRVSSARVLGAVPLPGWVLRFNKVSDDGSGKANLERATNQASETWGVLVEIDPTQRPELDRAERGYTPTELEALHNGCLTSALLYLADPLRTESSLRPHTWYKDFLIVGAREHGLPEGYVLTLEKVPATTDPSPRREARNRLFLTGRARKA